MHRYICMHYCTFWLHRPWQSLSLSFAPHTSPLLIFLLPSLTQFCPSSLGRLSCIRCSLTDPLSTASARLRFGQLFFPDKTSRYVLLAFSFPLFSLILFLSSDFSFKLSLFEKRKNNAVLTAAFNFL